MHSFSYADSVIVSVEDAIKDWHEHVAHNEKIVAKNSMSIESSYTPSIEMSRGEIEVWHDEIPSGSTPISMKWEDSIV